MYKLLGLFLLVALAVATPSPKPAEQKDLKTSQSWGLGYYDNWYGAYPGYHRGYGARSLFGVDPYAYNPLAYNGYYPHNIGYPYYW